MITNLVASITISLVTNITERFPQHLESTPCPDVVAGSISTCATFHGKWVDDPHPRQKWVKTTVSRVKTVSFDWLGKRREATESDTLSETEVEQSLESKWQPVSTNQVNLPIVIALPGTTNILRLTNTINGWSLWQ